MLDRLLMSSDRHFSSNLQCLLIHFSIYCEQLRDKVHCYLLNENLAHQMPLESVNARTLQVESALLNYQQFILIIKSGNSFLSSIEVHDQLVRFNYQHFTLIIKQGNSFLASIEQHEWFLRDIKIVRNAIRSLICVPQNLITLSQANCINSSL